MLRRLAPAAFAALLALPTAAQGPAAPPAGGEPPCAPVKPCEIPDEPGAAPAEAPADLGAEARALFDLVSCAGAAPSGLDAGVVSGFCAGQRKAIAAYRQRLPQTTAALARLRPAGLPSTVIQPFGGDLLSALDALPDARNVTTLSDARAGDPRRLLGTRSAPELKRDLERLRAASARLLGQGAAGDRGAATDPLALDLVALAVHGYQPASLRYFRVERDGSLHYLTRAELSADPSGSSVASAELTFVRQGEDPKSRARTHRLLSAGVTDAALARMPGVLAHLSSKGEVVAMVTGAGPRLRRADAGKLRDLVARQAVWVLSDASAPFPVDGASGALVQELHGAYAVARRAGSHSSR